MSTPEDGRPDPTSDNPGPAETGTETAVEHTAPAGVEDAPRPPEGTWHATVRQITTGDVLVGFLAVLLAVIVGSLLILLTDEEVREAAGYITARPSDFFQAASDAITGAYTALFRGSIYNTRATDFETGIRPLTETLKFAGPLIAAGLGIGLGFRAGLFNIGGRGQMLLAGAAAGWVAINVGLPGPLLLIAAVAAGMVAGALWGGLAGLLKARTGAHEVIVTIMLNYVGFYLVFYLLATQGLLQAPGSVNAKSLPPPERPAAQGPR